jgi:hypothetical protein
LFILFGKVEEYSPFLFLILDICFLILDKNAQIDGLVRLATVEQRITDRQR